MDSSEHQPQHLAFDRFDVDLHSGELRKSGRKIRLQAQPFRLLTLLLKRPGEVVTREEIRAALWPSHTFVDFDHSLGTAVNKIREALGDSAEQPRFVETLPRRGYRFVMAVQAAGETQTTPNAEAGVSASVGAPSSSGRKIAALFLSAALAALAVLATKAWRRDLTATSGVGRIQSLAVLPLENLSTDPEQEYFADGLTDELITSLAQVRSLRVISRTSVMRYRKPRRPAPEIGKELGVDALIEGTVLRSGDNVRVTVQLIEARTDRHLWAEEYQRELRDVISLQNGVARDIAQSVNVRLTPMEHALLSRTRPVNPEAEELRWKGVFFMNKFTASSSVRAKELFGQALQKDSMSAHTWADLAVAEHLLGMWGDYDAFPRAKTAATRATELDTSLAEPHAVLGLVAFDYDWDTAMADKEFRRAIELDPNDAGGHAGYATVLAHMGRFEEANYEMNRTRELDPISVINTSMAWHVYFCARRYDKAIQVIEEALYMNPSFFPAHGQLLSSWEQAGDYRKAIEEFRQARLLSGMDQKSVEQEADALTKALTKNGERGYWQEQLRYALATFDPTSHYGYWDIAEDYARLGNADESFRWIEKACQVRDPFLIFWLPITPVFDHLRTDPGYARAVRCLSPRPH